MRKAFRNCPSLQTNEFGFHSRFQLKKNTDPTESPQSSFVVASSVLEQTMAVSLHGHFVEHFICKERKSRHLRKTPGTTLMPHTISRGNLNQQLLEAGPKRSKVATFPSTATLARSPVKAQKILSECARTRESPRLSRGSGRKGVRAGENTTRSRRIRLLEQAPRLEFGSRPVVAMLRRTREADSIFIGLLLWRRLS